MTKSFYVNLENDPENGDLLRYDAITQTWKPFKPQFLTQEAYDALPEDDKNSGWYFIIK